MTEIELRFQIPEPQWAAVHHWVEGDSAAAGTKAHRERLRASYFDTPARDLARAGFALRLRLEGDTWVQTLKGAAPDGMTRLEHNVPVQGDAPTLDLTRHADHAAGRALQALLERLDAPALQALFHTDIERLSRALVTPFGEVELALDRGALLAGEGAQQRRLPVAELEIELKHGDPRAVLEVAREWALGRFGLTLELRTKALRGDLLARGEATAPARMSKPAAWRPDHTQAQALAVLLQACVEPVLGNASQIISGVHQPEHVHQLRVALRRLRVGVDLLCADAALGKDATHRVADEDRTALRSLGEGARQLGRALTPARDADAQRQAHWRPALEAAWQRSALVSRPDRPAASAARSEPPPAALLAQTLWQDWMLSIIAWLVRGWPVSESMQPVTGEVDRLADQALRLARRFDRLDVEGRHHLRRRMRRWKLALEGTAALWASGEVAPAARGRAGKDMPRQVARLIASIQRMQKPLGDLNDLEVAVAAAREALVRALADGDAYGAARAGFDLGWLTPVRHEALARVGRRFKHLKRLKRSRHLPR